MANEINIAELRQLHAETTVGKWRNGFSGYEAFTVLIGNDVVDFGFGGEKNAAFIAASHNVMPALLDELERLRAFKIDGMTIGDLNKLRSMLTEATIARTEYERALNASEERVAELLRSNKQLRDALQELHDFSDVLQGGEFVRWNQVRGKAVEALRETE